MRIIRRVYTQYGLNGMCVHGLEKIEKVSEFVTVCHNILNTSALTNRHEYSIIRANET